MTRNQNIFEDHIAILSNHIKGHFYLLGSQSTILKSRAKKTLFMIVGNELRILHPELNMQIFFPPIVVHT